MGEELLVDVVDVVVPIVEACGVTVISYGALTAFARLVTGLLRRDGERSLSRARLRLGRLLVVGLEFQLAADILRSAVAPSFEEIGQLAAIAAIRTALNFFLERELRQEQERLDADRPESGAVGQPTPA
ncbi:hypothetical protein BH20ACT19_BH20ACT19_11710 [soil metagenome]